MEIIRRSLESVTKRGRSKYLCSKARITTRMMEVHPRNKRPCLLKLKINMRNTFLRRPNKKGKNPLLTMILGATSCPESNPILALLPKFNSLPYLCLDDPYVWKRPDNKSYGTPYYTYILIYIDDTLLIN